MRIKILMFGDDPASLVADGQLLRDRGLHVFTAFNPENISELIIELKPEVIFFNANRQNEVITETYNNIVNSVFFKDIPVIFTLSEDDVYLVTRKRTALKEKRTMIADNIIDAIKIAMESSKPHPKKGTGTNHHTRPGNLNEPFFNNTSIQATQLQLPIYFR